MQRLAKISACRVAVRALPSTFMSTTAVMPLPSTFLVNPTQQRWYCEKKEEKPAEEKKPEEKPAKEEVKKAAAVDKKDEEIAELKKKVMYALADAENARRIAREDTEKAREYSMQSFAKDMLEVIDSIEYSVEAFAKVPKEDADKVPSLSTINTGLKMCQSIAVKALNKQGVKKMEVVVGAKFDPNQHDALFTSPATKDVAPDHIANVVKSGYMIKDRVLRAAQVGVAQKQDSE